jgi:quercetin dioxygenase-like cupin family protein
MRLARVTRKHERRHLDLESGARWERLNPPGEREFDFMLSTYDVAGSSGPDGMFSRHPGKEWGLVLSGRLKITVGFEEYELEAGDSITFDSQTPHRLENPGDEPAHTVWFVIGRSSDVRATWNAVTPPRNGSD